MKLLLVARVTRWDDDDLPELEMAMRAEPRFTRILMLVSLLGLLMPAGAVDAGVSQERTIRERYDAAGLRELVFDVGIGEFELTGGDGDGVQVEIRVDCDGPGWGSGGCEERAERVALRADRDGDRLEIALEGTSAWRNRGMGIEIRVTAPADLATSIDMSIGELTVERMTGDLTIDLGIGEVSVRAPESAFRSVALDVGTGEASLRGGDAGRLESAGLFVREVAWTRGTGAARMRVDLGIGEIDVRLEG